MFFLLIIPTPKVDRSNNHRDPPKTPVYSYHCIHEVVSENTFPSWSHGHEKSQWRCSSSKLIQKVVRNNNPACVDNFLMTIRESIKTTVILELFTITAKNIPNADAFHIHHDIPKFQRKKLRKKWRSYKNVLKRNGWSWVIIKRRWNCNC